MIWSPLKLLACCRSALVTAEALAWHHGSNGVAMARNAAEGPHGNALEAFQASLAANLAEDRYDCLRSCDTATRYDLGESCARRREQGPAATRTNLSNSPWF